jgi:uncharacterized protein
MSDEPSVYRARSISYVRIPTRDPRESSRFYATVFGWTIRGNADNPAFTDGSGHVIGHFSKDQAPTGDDGIRPYIYVESVSDVIATALDNGAKLIVAPYPEGNLTVATIRDPQGNTIGIWQQT